jgi:predicted dehydrogenase
MRVGFFGIAHLHADAYVRNLRAIEGIEVIGAADADSDALSLWCERFEVPAFEQFEQLADAGLDAVLVCSANNEHLAHVRIAASAGLHVLCEKPLATSRRDAAQIVDLCECAGVSLMVAFPMRFSPAFVEMRELIRAGEIGEIAAAVGVNQARLPYRAESWFTDPLRAGGGAIMDHVVHLADALRWILAEEITEVYGCTNQVIHPELAVETGGLLLVTLADGVIASIDSSWSRPESFATWGGLELEVIGASGVITANGFAQRLRVSSNQLPHVRLPDWGSDLNQLMVEEFVAAVRESRDPAVTGNDGLRATEVALAVYESVAAGGPISLAQP